SSASSTSSSRHRCAGPTAASRAASGSCSTTSSPPDMPCWRSRYWSTCKGTDAMTDHELDGLARRVGEALAARGLWLATAESCTGGWIAEAVTAIAGSSGWFDRGFVTYSNAAKADMLGVRDDTLE